MLKIKDNIDLKELEKYGIHPTLIDTGTGRTVIQDELWWFPSGLMIDINSREILLHSGEYEKDKISTNILMPLGGTAARISAVGNDS